MWGWLRQQRLWKAEVQAEAERFVRESPKGLAYVYACNADAQAAPASPEQARAAAVRLAVKRMVRPGPDTATCMARDAALI